MNGINIKVKGKKSQIFCNKEVIISAGSVGSPKILELSGIGNAQILKKYGIDHSY